jgi:2-oxo-3-hexenedioate decarboxylase
MHTQPDIRSIAAQMKAAQDQVRQIRPFTSELGALDLSSAYEVSHLIHEARVAEGSVPVGRKIGFTNPEMWALYGVREPIWAYMYDKTVIHLPDQHQTCSLERFTEPKIEPEIVFHFRSAPPVNGDLRAILDCIDWVAHGFEIVQSHFPGWKFQAADTVADGGLHGTLLLGEPQPVARLEPGLVAALESFSINLLCAGDVRAVGRGLNVLGSPLAAIAHLIAVLARQPQSMPLQADEMVTTGTVTAAQAVRPGETWRTAIEGIALPGLSARFVD